MPVPAVPALAACLGLAADPAAWQAMSARRQNSRLYRVGAGSSAVIVKQCLRGAAGERDEPGAVREYDALTRLHSAASAQGIAPLAPQPIALCREHAAYVMTAVRGVSLTQCLLRARDAAQAVRLGECAGDWLRRFHALRPLGERSGDFLQKAERAAAWRQHRGRHQALVRRAAAALVTAAPAAAAVVMPASWVHGDMKSDNVLVHDGHATGIDVQLVDENTVVYDLAPFLNHLGLLGWSPRGLRRRSLIARAAAAFLAAYPARPSWQLAIAWLRTYLLVQAATRDAGGSPWRAWVARAPAALELRRAVRELAAL